MMKTRNYYTLVTSLPYLPRFNKAESLPINRIRLLHRLKMLDPEDYNLADKVAEFIAWRRHPIAKTTEEMIAIYNQGVKQMYASPILKKLFEFPINQRTIMTALRLREMGATPRPEQSWGVGNLVKQITFNWDHPQFKLGSIFPWIGQAQTLLKEGESLMLEYLLMNLTWNNLDRLLLKNYFGFEVVIAYLLKWDMIQQWLSYNKDVAKLRFEELILEVIK